MRVHYQTLHKSCYSNLGSFSHFRFFVRLKTITYFVITQFYLNLFESRCKSPDIFQFFHNFYIVNNKLLNREEQNKFSKKKVSSSGDWTWDPLWCLPHWANWGIFNSAFICASIDFWTLDDLAKINRAWLQKDLKSFISNSKSAQSGRHQSGSQEVPES